MIELNDDKFDDVVENGVVLVDFWAEWCGPCKMLSPIIDEIASEMGDKVKFCKFNVDNGKIIPTKFDISSIPTLILFKDGALVSQRSGLTSKQILEDWILDNIN
ncbi:MAG: thioredoxin [Rickettsiales bacterium]|jgi:thioredoxin 1|nr:thioredoxin [Rickettsiales bacterium]